MTTGQCVRRDDRLVDHIARRVPGVCAQVVSSEQKTAAELGPTVGDSDNGTGEGQRADTRSEEPAADRLVLPRADELKASQSVTEVDEAFQAVTQVVRGVDLLASTPRQIYLQQCLGLPQPDYAHLPLLVDRQGMKLGKQTGAGPLDDRHASDNLRRVLTALTLPPPPDLRGAPPATLLQWATAQWEASRLAGQMAIAQP